MTRLNSVVSCAAMFAFLKLATDLYHSGYYGVPTNALSLLVNALIIAAIGALGYVSGTLRLGHTFGLRTNLYIAFLGYFVAYSIARLLQSMLPASWLFLMCIYLVTMLVTMKLGPKWEKGAS